jgi:hypothetical protein
MQNVSQPQHKNLFEQSGKPRWTDRVAKKLKIKPNGDFKNEIKYFMVHFP